MISDNDVRSAKLLNFAEYLHTFSVAIAVLARILGCGGIFLSREEGIRVPLGTDIVPGGQRFMRPEGVDNKAPGGASAPNGLVFRELCVIVIGVKGLSDRVLFLGIVGFVAASLRTSVRIMRVIIAEFICRINNKGLMPQRYNPGQPKRIPVP